MITDPKVGDIVTLDPERYAGWMNYLQFGERYQITKITRQRNQWACRLRHLYTGNVVPKAATTHGTWACYLIRDEFLSQAYHAQKEAAA